MVSTIADGFVGEEDEEEKEEEEVKVEMEVEEKSGLGKRKRWGFLEYGYQGGSSYKIQFLGCRFNTTHTMRIFHLLSTFRWYVGIRLDRPVPFIV
ncbi:hypothetical protein HZH66_005321 [Vespula vulgaris]|uniref:Uncharacterized protein n=1 Tax=Vespula vulgaris TaxID=7454 RepID=A0A834NCG9_VESVU|nr:hypothetical protein HZH66_005321 [Vespula vulgaris]